MAYGLPRSEHGVIIVAVQPGSPADAAGLQVKDVVTSLDGQPIASSSDLQRAVAEHHAGTTLTMTALRSGNNLSLSAAPEAIVHASQAAINDQKEQDKTRKLAALDMQSPTYAHDFCALEDPSRLQACIQSTQQYAALMARGYPMLDSDAYCLRVSDAGGGSNEIELQCRKLEKSADTWVRDNLGTARIMNYCTEVAEAGGGSYQILEGCMKREAAAAEQL